MLFPTSAITPKAKILADVVGKRAELEKYLTELDVVRVNEVEQTIDPALIDSGLTNKDSVKLISSISENIDSTKNKPNPSEHNIDGYTFNPSDIHVVVLVLQKIDNCLIRRVTRHNPKECVGWHLTSSLL